MAPKKYKTVNEAAHSVTRKRKTTGPQDEAFRQPEPNPFGPATKLNKAKGSPKTHKDGLGPPAKSTSTKSKNRFKQGGYLA
jgi:hypothetical protein